MHPILLDEHSSSDLREVYGRLAARAERLDAAVGRVRLGGMTLGTRELGGLRRVRLILAEMNALTFACEAEALAADPGRRGRLPLLEELLQRGTLEIRLAPLAGWTPDFSVFSGGTDPGAVGRTPTLVLGPHWFERPYPHPGPALNAVLRGEPARRAARRFTGLWERGHDVSGPILSVIARATRTTPIEVEAELTPRGASGYSYRTAPAPAGDDPV